MPARVAKLWVPDRIEAIEEAPKTAGRCDRALGAPGADGGG